MGGMELDDVVEAFTEFVKLIGGKIPIPSLSRQPQLRVTHLLERHQLTEPRCIRFGAGEGGPLRAGAGGCLHAAPSMDTAATNTNIRDAWRITLRIGNLEHSVNQQCRQRLVYCSRERDSLTDAAMKGRPSTLVSVTSFGRNQFSVQVRWLDEMERSRRACTLRAEASADDSCSLTDTISMPLFWPRTS